MHKITEFRQRRKARIVEMLGGQCVLCGSTDQLEVDHVDPSQKSFTLSGNNLNWAWEKLLPEIAKCQLLCHVHHIDKSAKEASERTPWNKGKTRDGLMRPENEHGTWFAYDTLKCRCKSCKKWKKLYRKKLVDTIGRPIVA